MSMAIGYHMNKKRERCDEHGVQMCEMCHGGKMAEGGFVHEEEASGYRSMPQERDPRNMRAMHEDERMLNQHGEDEFGADGTEDDDERLREKQYGHPVENQSYHAKMLGRIHEKLDKHYSKGGMVANETPVAADFEDNEFDDLVKDDHLEEHYTGANSGDEHGDEQEDEDRRDIVKRIMRSLDKKDRMPRPA